MPTPTAPGDATDPAGAGTFVALLRGINVGGRKAVPMAALRAGLTARGLTGVQTYIASGNVLFGAPATADEPGRLAVLIEAAVAEDFGFPCRVLVKRGAEVVAIAAAIPSQWTNDTAVKADVLYLFGDVDDPAVPARLPLVSGVDHAQYTPGAVLWTVERRVQARSGLVRIVGTDLYARMTIRNVNTARTLAAMVLARACVDSPDQMCDS